MSDRGLALNDCHAEIIARRSLIRYLYTQLEFFLRSAAGVKWHLFKRSLLLSYCLSIKLLQLLFPVLFWKKFCAAFPSFPIVLSFFYSLSNNKEEHQKSIFVLCDKGGYRLNDNVQFHLYISTSPCGDARIFSPHEAGVEGAHQFSLCFASPHQLCRHVFSLEFSFDKCLFYLIEMEVSL